MLNNALNDPDIRALLEQRGYTTEKFNEGLAKVQNTQAKQVAKDVARGNQLAATDAFKAASAAARRVYTDFRETAQAHFGSEAQNREAWQKLGLGGTVPLDTEKFIGAAYTTFDSVLAEAISVLARRIHEQRRTADLDRLVARMLADYPMDDILWVLPDVPTFYSDVVELVRFSGGELNFNDALFALSCRYREIPFIASFDGDFDQLAWLRRLAQPEDLS